MMQKYEHIYLEEIGSVYMVRIEIKCNNTENIIFNYRSYYMRKKKIYEGRKKNIFEVLACARVCVKSV